MMAETVRHSSSVTRVRSSEWRMMYTPGCEQSQCTLNHKIQQYANSTTNVGIFVNVRLGYYYITLYTNL